MLMYADDMVLMATCPVDLQKQLDLLYEFCASTGLQVTLDKTEIVVDQKAKSKLAQGGFTEAQCILLFVLYLCRLNAAASCGLFLLPRGLLALNQKFSVARNALKAAGQRVLWAMLGNLRGRLVIPRVSVWGWCNAGSSQERAGLAAGQGMVQAGM